MGLEERENKRKKSIVGAMISGPQELPDAETLPQNNISVVAPSKAETRSKKVNILLPPSVYAEAKNKCETMGVSLNECINQLLSNWVRM
jgi:hypothetical protein